jgi:hypothetical protein
VETAWWAQNRRGGEGFGVEQGQLFFDDVDLTGSVAWLIEETLAEEKKECLEDPLGGLQALIELASGTPFVIAGTGYSFDAGLGPTID